MTNLELLMEYMEQNQYFIGNDLLAKYNELLQKETKKQLILTDVVKCNCKIPHPRMKVSENGISGYCANCIKPL